MKPSRITDKQYNLRGVILDVFSLIGGSVFVFALIAILVGGAKVSNAAFNPQINYQAKLTATTSIAVADGAYNIRFKLYTTASGGSPIWTEAWCYSPDNGTTCNGTGTDGRVGITGGLFSTLLGSTTSLTGIDFNQTLYLGVEIGGSGSSAAWDGEMTPRKMLGAVPAAFVAQSAATLSGLNANQFLRSDAVNATSTASTFLSIIQNGVGKIAEFFSNTVGSVLSLLSNGNVGIGTSTPTAKLAIQATAGGSTPLFTIASSTNGTGTSTALFVAANGNVGIGTAAPVYKLDVNGTISGNYIVSGNYVRAATGSAFVWNNRSNMYSPADGLIEFVNSANTDFSRLQFGGTTSSFPSLQVSTSTSANGVALQVIGADGVGAANLLVSGNVGIGTTSPFARLSVAGDTYIAGNFTATGTATIGNLSGVIWGTNGVLSAVSTSSLGFMDSATIGNGTLGQMPYYTGVGNTLAATSSLFIGQNGNVGVGTTSPFAQLSVQATGGGTAPLFAIASSTNGAATSTALFVRNDGKIGIGTANIINGYFMDVVAPAATMAAVFQASNGYQLLELRDIAGSQRAWFGNDQGTRVQLKNFITNGNINLVTNGTGNVIVDNGNFGIGTTSPLAKLDVVGALNGTAPLFQVSKLTGSYATSTSLIVDSSGNIAIGTSTATSLLTLGAGTNSGATRVALTFNNDGYNEPVAPLSVSSGDKLVLYNSSTGRMALGVDGSYGAWLASGGNSNSKIRFMTSASGVALDRMVITSAGNIGIGTTSPALKLEVVGTSALPAKSGTAQTGIARFSNQTAPTLTSVIDIGSYNTTGAGWLQATDRLDLSTGYALLLNPNGGNVGIGTTSPSSKLTVNGTSYFAGAIFATSSITTQGDSSTDSAPISSTELTDATGWTSTDWTGDYNVGFTHTTGNTTNLSRTMTIAANTLYQVSVAVTGRTAGNFTIALGYATSTQTFGNANATFTFGPKTLATGANAPLVIIPASTFDGKIASISVKAITGTNSAVYALKDSTGTTGTEIRQTLASLNNTFIGLGAGRYNTTGSNNTANGYASLYSNTTGSYNTANGMYSLYSNTTGSNNTANGYASLYSNTTGSYNTANGMYSLYYNTTGIQNTANGYTSLFSNTTGSNNTANGYQSLFSNTTGSNNTANGYYSLYSNTTGTSNTANGMYSLFYNTTGTSNTANGNYSLYSNTTGTSNTANGVYSLFSNTTGTGNAAFGYESLRYNPSATSSTAFGYQAGRGATGQANQNNSLFGYQSGYALTTGSNNTLLGYASGDALLTGSNNILIGYNVEATSTDSVNFLNIGNTIYGNMGTGNVGIGTTSPVGKLDIFGGSLALQGQTGGDTIRLNGAAAGVGTTFESLNASRTNYAPISMYGTAFNYINGASSRTDLTILSNGNVGIGTTSPFARLSVAGDTYIAGNFTATGTATIGNLSGLIWGTNGLLSAVSTSTLGLMSSTTIGMGTLGQMPYYTGVGNTLAATSSLFMAQSGNVGIGTASPIRSLTMYGANPGFSIQDNQGTNNFMDVAVGSIGSGLVFKAGKLFTFGSVPTPGYTSWSNATGTLSVDERTDTNGRMAFGLNPNGGVAQSKFDLNGNMSIGSYAGVNAAPANGLIVSGNVGIGTTTPSQKLDVAGNIAFGDRTDGYGRIFLNQKSARALPTVVMVGTDDGTENSINFGGGTTMGYATKNVYFHTAANDTTNGSSIRMAINSSGNIGIGTTSPFARLSVAGDTYIAGNFTATGTATIGNLSGVIWGTNGVLSAVSTSTLGLMSSTTIGNGTLGQMPYYTGVGNTLAATSTLFIGTNSNVGIGMAPTASKLTIKDNSTTVYGPEKVTNGTFTGNASGWTLGNGWTYNSNNIKFTTGGTGTLSQNIGAVGGECYLVSYSGTPVSGMLLFGFAIGDTSPSGFFVSGPSSSTSILCPTISGNLVVSVMLDYGGIVTLDDISVKKVTVTNNPVLSLYNVDGSAGLELRAGGGLLTYNSFVGNNAGLNNISGFSNSFFGAEAGKSNNTGSSNTAVGYNSLTANTSGYGNTASGVSSMYRNVSGNYNTAFGNGSLSSNVIGNNNTTLGYSAGSNVLGSSNIMLGNYAGQYETGTSTFYLDNQNRGSNAGERANALLFGTFDAAAANQNLTINAHLNVTGTSTFTGQAVFNNYVGIGTSTPQYVLTIASSTAPQLSLSAGAGISQWIMRNAGGNFYLATTTLAGTATSTVSALTIVGSTGNVGIGTTTATEKLVVEGNIAPSLTNTYSAGSFTLNSAVASAANITISGIADNNSLGYSVASAGDVNGDGVNDIIVGAPYAVSNSGQAYIFFGSTTPRTTFNPSAADVTISGIAVNNYLGASVASVGDVNGDGYADIIISATYAAGGGTSRGQAYIFYGGLGFRGSYVASSANVTISGIANGDYLGNSVASAGDVNGDGYADVIVGAQNAAGGGTFRGQAYIFYGGPTLSGTKIASAANVTISGIADYDYLGNSVVSAGDVNGDGYADVIVGAQNVAAGGTYRGQAYIFYGSPALSGSKVASVANVTISGISNSSYLGSSVASAGDVNGDGYADVIIGAYKAAGGGTQRGQAYLFYGGPTLSGTKIASVANVTLSGLADSSRFGYSVASAGDVNGDGYADIIIGAIYADAAGIQRGQAYVFYGSPALSGSKIASVADVTFSGIANLNSFGNSVASAGDVNGDGYADIIVGAPSAAGGGAGRGQAYIFSGTGNRFSSVYSQSGSFTKGIQIGGGAATLNSFGLSSNNPFSLDTSDWSISRLGSAFLQNATISNFLAIGTTATSSMLTIQGIGSYDLLNISSSTGASLLTLKSNGNVGIGSTTPYAKLSIQNGGLLTDTYNPTLFTVASSTNGTATTTIFTVLANGNVGVGTAAPTGIFDVEGGTASSGNGKGIILNAQNGANSGDTAGGSIDIKAGSPGSGGTGAAGAVNIEGGWNGSNSGGGAINVTGGMSGGSGVGGTISITGGMSNNQNGAAVTISGGNTLFGTGFAGGEVNIIGGTGYVIGNTIGGAVNITGGPGFGTNMPGGNVVLTAGTSTGSGSSGVIELMGGNVGIGTTTPYAKLSVHAGATDGYNSTIFSVASSTAAYATSTLFAVLANGNVGVGTSTPAAVLDIYNSNPAANLLNVTGSSATHGLGLTFYDVYNNASARNWEFGASIAPGFGWDFMRGTTPGGAPTTLAMRINNSGYLGIGSTFSNTNLAASLLSVAGNTSIGSTYAFTAAPSNGMIVEGNVGIGTTTPAYKLQVNSASGQSGIALYNSTVNKGWLWYPVTNSAATDMRLQEVGVGDKFTFQAGGNLGIGTTTPIYTLTIASSTAPQLSLSAGAGISQWIMRNAGGNFYLATTTAAGTATSTISALSVLGASGNVGIGTTSITEKLTVGGNIAPSMTNMFSAGSYGLNSAVASAANILISGIADYHNLGTSVASAGDVNGDGISDIIVSAIYANGGGTARGQAYIFFGSTTPRTTFNPSLADVTVSGVADSDQLGNSVASAGDVNGDGYGDVIISASSAASYTGQNYIFYGGPNFRGAYVASSANVIISGSATTVASAGDVNGDGYTDILIGHPSGSDTGVNHGQAHVFYGGPKLSGSISPSSANVTINGLVDYDQLGQTVASAGDVNGDGYADIIIGSPSAGNGGRVWLFYGGPNFKGSYSASSANLIITPVSTTGYFGQTVASAGDVNGDGISDIIVSAYLENAVGNDRGQVYIFFGGPTLSGTKVASSSNVIISGSVDYNAFGSSVAPAGDMNGDGYADVVIGAWPAAGGGASRGQAYVFYGGPKLSGSISASAANATYSGINDYGHFGWQVASAGDINGDGYPDIIVGADEALGGGTRRGQAYIFTPTGNRFSSVYSQSGSFTKGIQIGGGAATLNNFGLTSNNPFNITTPDWSISRLGLASLLNANVANFLAVGTTSTSSMLTIQGIGSNDLLSISSSTGSSLLTLKSNGNIGIGTTSPIGKFEINPLSSVYSNPYKHINDGVAYIAGSQSQSTSDHSALLSLVDTSNVVGNAGGVSFGGAYYNFGDSYYGTAGRIRGYMNQWSYGGGMLFETVSPITGDIVESMRINSSGNVGIGTTSPFAKLSIQGNAYVAGNFTATGTATIGTLTGPLQAVNGLVSATGTISVAYGGTGTSTAPGYGQLLIGNANGDYDLVATTSLNILAASSLGFGTQGYIPYYPSNGLQALTATSSIFIAQNGFIGMGTTTPDAALSVFNTAAPQFKLAYDKNNFLTTAVSATGGVTMAVTGSVGGFSITNPQPATVSSGTGTNAPVSLTVNGATGGNSNDTNIGTGGIGGGIALAGGLGGSAALSTFAENGGAGGVVSILAGAGAGASSADSDFILRTAGNGGLLTLAAGAGGAAANGGFASYNVAGNGGNFLMKGGVGGNATGADTNNGGNGGSLYLAGGLGGTGSSLNGTSGDLYLGYDSSNVLGNVYFGNRGATYVTSTGNFGVGTTSPYAKLSVVGPVVAEYFHATSTTATSTIAGGFMVAGNGVSTGLFVQANGQVGIGTTVFQNYDLNVNNSRFRTVRATNSMTLENSGASLLGGNFNYYTPYMTNSGSCPMCAELSSGKGIYLNIDSDNDDADTQVFAIGKNGLLASTTNLFTVRESGNVGIGTTSPFADMSIQSLGGTNPLFVIASSTNGAGTSTALFVGANGNVGIGTAAPAYGLDVWSSNGVRINTSSNPIYLGCCSTDSSLSYRAWNTKYNGPMSITNADTNGGAYINFQTGLTEKMRIDYAGNVGIGTTTPYAKLSVHAGATDGYNSTIFSVASSTTAYATSTLFAVLANGNVGVGTTTPFGQLSVLSSSVANPTLVLQGATNQVNYLQIYTPTAGYPMLTVSNVGTDAAPQTRIAPAFGNLQVYGGGGASLFLGASGTTGAVVTGGGITVSGSSGLFVTVGNTGLGTSTPLAKLDVVNTLGSQQDLLNVSSTTATNVFSSLFKVQSNGNVGIGSTSPFADMSIQSLGGTNPLFVIASSTNGAGTSTALYVAANGNVGIGTNSPLAQLALFKTDSSGLTDLLINPGVKTSGNLLDLQVGGSGKVSIDFGGTYRGPNFYVTGPAGAGSFQPRNPGQDVIFTNQGGVELSRMTNAGNVGIGTTSPYAKLSVAGGVVADYFYATSTTATSTFAGGLNVGNGALTYDLNSGITSISGLQLSGAMSFDTDAGMVSWIDMPQSLASSGSVQGYSASLGGMPILTVYGLSDGVGGIIANSSTVAIGTSSPYTNGLTLWGGDSLAATRILDVVNSASTSVLTAFADGSVKLGGGVGITTLYATANGNVGIGTTSPYARLSVHAGATDTYNPTLFAIGSSTSAYATSTLFSVLANGNTTVGGAFTSTGVLTAANGISVSSGSLSVLQGKLTVINNSTSNIAVTVQGAAGQTADLVRIQDSNLKTLFNVDSTGNVGIGTSTPFAKLSIQATAGGSTPLFTIASSTNGLATSTALFVATNGNVGIGTASPLSTLSVIGNTYVSNRIGVNKAVPNTAIEVTNGTFRSSMSAAEYSYFIDMYVTGSYPNITGNIQTGNITPWLDLSTQSGDQGAGAGIRFKPNSVERMRIDVGGNVGIGTTSPYAKLSVVGGVVADYFFATSTTATSTFAGGLNVGNGGLVYDSYTGITSASAFQTGNFNFELNAGAVSWADLTVDTGASAGTPESYTANLNGLPMLTIGGLSDGAGNITNAGVGIGTTSPFSKFSVSGDTWLDSGTIRIGSTTSTTGTIMAFQSSATTTIPNNKAFAWTIATSTTAEPLFKIDTLGGYATTTIGGSGSGDVQIGDANSPTNLLFGASASILAGGNTITFGGAGDKFNFAVNLGIASATPRSALTVGAGDIGAYNGAICADNGGLVKCYAALTAGVVYGDSSSFTASDLAENYSAAEAGLEAGDIVSAAESLSDAEKNKRLRDKFALSSLYSGNIPESILNALDIPVTKADSATSSVIGIVSTKPGVLLGDVTGTDLETTVKPIALSGRVPVKVNNEGGAIKTGDRIALSSVAGVGRKAKSTEAGVGIALENFSGVTGKINVFVNLAKADSSAETVATLSSQVNSLVSNISANASTTDPVIKIASNGKVGIGLSASTTPDYLLHVSGDVAAQSFVNLSSISFKKDVTYMADEQSSDTLKKIDAMKIANYRYNNEDSSVPLHLGLIAEEAPQEILSANGKGVDLYKMTTFILAGMQAQSKMLDSLASSTATLAAANTTSAFTNVIPDLNSQIAALNLRVDALVASSTEYLTMSSSTMQILADNIANNFGDRLAAKAADNLASSTSFIGKIAESVRSAIASSENWIVGRLTAQVAYIGRVEADVVTVSNGFEMVDQMTGAVWCVQVKNGDFGKQQGKCTNQVQVPVIASTTVTTVTTITPDITLISTTTVSTPTPTPVSTSTPTLDSTPVATPVPTVISTSTDASGQSSNGDVSASSTPAVTPVPTPTVTPDPTPIATPTPTASPVIEPSPSSQPAASETVPAAVESVATPTAEIAPPPAAAPVDVAPVSVSTSE